jgi:hypothetical protein
MMAGLRFWGLLLAGLARGEAGGCRTYRRSDPEFSGCVAGGNLDASVTYLGRYALVDGIQRADWSSAGISFWFEPDVSDASSLAQVSIEFSQADDELSFFVDAFAADSKLVTFEVTVKQFVLNLSFPLVKQDISVRRRTEAGSSGSLGLVSVTAYGGSISRTPEADSLKMIFLGDSITAGYGIEGAMPCTFSPDTENSLLAYATLTARNLGALQSYHTLAWSGLGVVRNYGDLNPTSVDPMPVYYNRTLANVDTPENYWDPKKFQADVFVVALGANDYSTEPIPSDEQFIDGEIFLLSFVRVKVLLRICFTASSDSNGLSFIRCSWSV